MTEHLEQMLRFSKFSSLPASTTVADFEKAADDLVASRQEPEETFHATYTRLFNDDDDMKSLLMAADRVRRALAKRKRQVEDLESATGCRVPSRCDNGSSPERCDRLVEDFAKAHARPGETVAAAVARLVKSDEWAQTTILAKRTAVVDPSLDLNPSADELELRRLADDAQVASAAAPSRASALLKAATVLRQQSDLALMARIGAEGAGNKLSIASLVEAEDTARRLLKAQVDGDPTELDGIDTADDAEALASMLRDAKKSFAARRLAKSLRAHEETLLKSGGDAEACWITDPERIRQKIAELQQRVHEAQFVGRIQEASRLHRMALALGNRLKAMQRSEAPSLKPPTEADLAAADAKMQERS